MSEDPRWVRSWVGKFLGEHADRVKRSDWPAVNRVDDLGEVEVDPYWDAYIYAFILKGGLTYELATEASKCVAAAPPEYLDKQLQALLTEIDRIRSEARTVAASGSAEQAKLASRDCLDCEGQGFARRFVHSDILGKIKTAGGSAVPVGGSVMYFCGCAQGKFLASKNQVKGMTRPPLTIDEYPSLRLQAVGWTDQPDNRYRYHPDQWNGWDDCPMSESDTNFAEASR